MRNGVRAERLCAGMAGGAAVAIEHHDLPVFEVGEVLLSFSNTSGAERPCAKRSSPRGPSIGSVMFCVATTPT